MAEGKGTTKSNNLLKSIWDEFVYGGHLLALGLSCMVFMSAMLIGVKITFEFLVVIYLLTLAPCLFGRYVDLKEDALTNPERSSYLSRKAKYIPVMIVSSIVVVVSILLLNRKLPILFIGVGLILFSFLYDLFFKKLTRKIIGFKNLYVGILFSMLVVMMMFYYGQHFGQAFYLTFTFLFLMTTMGAAFSDIKDIESDKKEGLKTFAVVLGHKKTLFFLMLVTVLSLVPILYGVTNNILPAFSVALVLVIPYNLYLFRESLRKDVNADYLYGFLFDSQLILWLVFVMVGEVFIR